MEKIKKKNSLPKIQPKEIFSVSGLLTALPLSRTPYGLRDKAKGLTNSTKNIGKDCHFLLYSNQIKKKKKFSELQVLRENEKRILSFIYEKSYGSWNESLIKASFVICRRWGPRKNLRQLLPSRDDEKIASKQPKIPSDVNLLIFSVVGIQFFILFCLRRLERSWWTNLKLRNLL